MGSKERQSRAIAILESIEPSHLFDKTELLDESTLDVEVISDDIVDSMARPGKRVRRIEIKFTSQDWHGMIWRHPAHIYHPAGYASDGNVGIIGTDRSFFFRPDNVPPDLRVLLEQRQIVPGTSLNTEEEYAEGTALDFNMAVMVFSNPPEDYLGLNESDLMGYCHDKMVETRDLTWDGYYSLTKAYLRAVTLLHSIPEIRAEHAVMIGCSKRGHALSIAAGSGDKRIAGVQVCCSSGGNTLYQIAVQSELLGLDKYAFAPENLMRGPGFWTAAERIRHIYNPFGLYAMLTYDPYFWADRVKCAYLVSVGTNDLLFGTQNEVVKVLKSSKALLLIDNTPHTWVSQKHLAGWRMWLAHTFYGRKIPTVEMKSEITGASLSVTARVQSESESNNVRLFYAPAVPFPITKTHNWVLSRWEARPMMATGEGRWTTNLELKDGQRVAYYVEMENSDKGVTGYITSYLKVVELGTHGSAAYE